jgi:hypothetical protein
MLLMGTAGGVPLWSTQISIPMDFKIQKIEESVAHKSLLARYSLDIGALVSFHEPITSIVAVIPLAPPQPQQSPLPTAATTTTTTATTFVVVHSSGKLVFWEMKPPHHRFRRHAAAWSVVDRLREHFIKTTQHLLYDMQVQAAVVSSSSWGENSNHKDAAMIVLLCNVQHSDDDRYDTAAAVGQTHRQYWVVVQDDKLRAVLPLPPTDVVTDCIVGTDGTPYMLLESTTIHDEPQQTIATLDMTQNSSLSPTISTQTLQNTTLFRGTLCPDHTTHGALLLPRDSPSLLRARFLAPSQSSGSDHDLPTSSPREVEVLRSLFESWYAASASNGDGPAAVSVTLENPYIHAAVLPLARTMSEQSLRNPMELHLSYIKFLQTVGLYKYLPESTKWSLLAIGQGLEVVKQVVETTTLGKQQQSPLPTITTKTIGHFLVEAQQNNGSSNNTAGLWLECLHTVLKVANLHRQKYAPPTNNGLSYDIIDPTLRAPPGLVWTVTILSSVLERQLSTWDALAPHGIPDIADPSMYLDIIQWILEAYRDYGDADAYAHAAQRVFAIARRTNRRKKRDPWLFVLCRDHCYFHGVLTIHADYTPCATFSLTAVAAAGAMGLDIETGQPFKHYALKWLAGTCEHNIISFGSTDANEIRHNLL